MFIVDAGESLAGNFVDFVEVMEIGSGVIFTAIAVAGGVEWFEHLAIFGIAYINATVWRIEGAVAGLARGGDAIESVATVFNANKEITRFGAHTKEVARFVVRDNFVGEFDNVGGFRGFSGIEGTNAVTVNGLFSHKFGRFAAKIFKETALDDSIKILFWFAGFFSSLSEALMFGDIAREPVMGANHGFFDEFFVVRIDGLIKGHVNVGADLPLGLHGDFGIHANFVAVDM